MKSYFQNIRCLHNKVVFFGNLLPIDCYDILMFAEHWETEDNIKLLPIKNFKMTSSFSRELKTHGGTAIYVKETLHAINRTDIIKLSIESQFEISAIEMQHNNSIYCCVYRPPNSDIEIFFDRLEMLLDLVFSENKQCIITGDFNIDTLVDSANCNQLNDILQSYCYTNIVVEPTRVQGASSTCLDHCYTNSEHNVQIKINKNTLSDHYGIEIIQRSIKPVNKKFDVTKRKFLNSKLSNKLNNILNDEDWCNVEQAVGVENKYHIFHETLLSHIDKVIPVTRCNWKDNKKEERDHLTIELQEQVKIFEELLSHSPENLEYKEKLIKSKLQLVNYINFKNCQKNTKIISESTNKQKTSWKVVYNNINKVNASVHKITHINIDNSQIIEPNLIANKFNNQFINKPIELTSTLTQNQNCPPSQFIKNPFNVNTFFVAPTTAAEVIKVIHSLKNSGAYDIYELSTHTIKSISKFIATPIAHIFNCSIEEGTFPSKLKFSKVVPIYKKSDAHDLNNYRPISILPIVSKVFEKLFLIRLQQFLAQFEIINSSQHGFRQNHSTTTAAYQFIEKIYESFDKGENALGLFIDLSKAFDLVDHIILISKLYRMGIRGIALDWIKSYLSNRKQKVYVNTSEGPGQSDIADVTQGVPQGSILGPLLYILYVNDFTLNFPGKHVIKYADDTSFLIQNIQKDTAQSETKHILAKCNNWFTEQNLVMNDSKTAIVLFHNGSNTIECNIELPDTTLSSSNDTKFLGLTVDSSLKWKQHTNSLCKKLSSALFALRTLRGKIDFTILLQVYHAVFESHLNYGIIFWGNSSNSNILRVLKMQKKAIRLLDGLKARDTCRESFMKLGLLTAVNLYIFNLLLFVMNNMEVISQVPVNHAYSTRNKNSFVRPLKHHTSIYEKSVSYSGLKLFNMLPIEIRSLKIIHFKYRIKKFLLNNPMYSINEFDTLDLSSI